MKKNEIAQQIIQQEIYVFFEKKNTSKEQNPRPIQYLQNQTNLEQGLSPPALQTPFFFLS